MCVKNFSIIVFNNLKNSSDIDKKKKQKKYVSTYEIIRFHVDLIEITPGPRITRQTPNVQRSVVHRVCRPVVHRVRRPVVRPGPRDRNHTDHYQ